MSSFSNINIIGRVGQDPEVRYSKAGDPVSNISIAVDDGWGDGKKTIWHQCVAFKKTAQVVADYVNKGSLIHISGVLTYNEWETKEGHKRKDAQIRIERLTLLGSKGDGGGDRNQQQQRQRTNHNTQVDNNVPETSQGDFDDEIPF